MAAYVTTGKFNVISVCWGKLAQVINYFRAAKDASEVGTVVGLLLSNLFNLDIVRSEDIHIIGHSLGAHVAGMTGKVYSHITNEKVDRISALDPAAPGFDYKKKKTKTKKFRSITKDDASFVDVIHTTGGLFGITRPIGHVDFYPNYGISPQKNCKHHMIWIMQAICSHKKAYKLYNESVVHGIRNDSIYVQCPSTKAFKLGFCANGVNPINWIGHNADRKHPGSFYRNYNDNPFNERSNSSSSNMKQLIPKS